MLDFFRDLILPAGRLVELRRQCLVETSTKCHLQEAACILALSTARAFRLDSCAAVAGHKAHSRLV
jgi:CO dehydrogenase/acetyl-CoA synthase alpha subunit